jgi:hypothetical protein
MTPRDGGTSGEGADLGEATESAAESYETTEQDESTLRPGSGDRNTASGSSTEDLAS